MLDRFMHEFIGYGNLAANLWFLGLEEAGCRSSADLIKRVEAWSALGAKPVVDLFEFHRLIEVTHLFGEAPKIQRTWRRLIQMALVSQSEEVTRPKIADYQARRLGRLRGETLLGELLPLPKPMTGSWPYAEVKTEQPFLATRREYERYLLPIRVALLREAIRAHQPQTVVFYGTSRRRLWSQVAGVDLAANESGYACVESGGQQYLLVKHPNARGVSADYYSEAAQSIG